MGTPPPSRIEVVALGPTAAEAVVWRLRGELRVTVAVKACFAFEPDAPMRIAEPEELIRTEVHHGSSPARSVRLTSELTPFQPKADVVLVGHAWAPDGESSLGMSVRLAVYREDALLDRSINVHSDRVGEEEVPFEKMPLTHERAYGGIGFPDNPFGIGADTTTAGKQPNLVDPKDPKRPACFGPIGRNMPARRRHLGDVDRRALDGAICEIPNGLNFEYFQSAPPEQQIDYLRGNEWIVLEGLHPVHVQICSCLPSAMGRARVFGLGAAGDGRVLGLVADTLRIDADALTCSVVWRGSFAVPDVEALATLTIFAGVDTVHESVDWPPPPAPRVPEAASAPEAVTAKGATPEAPAAEPARPKWDQTMEVRSGAPINARDPVVPFRTGPSNLPAPAPRAAPAKLSTTAVSAVEDAIPPTLPFTGHSLQRRRREPPPEPAVAEAPRPAPRSQPLSPPRFARDTSSPETMRIPSRPGVLLARSDVDEPSTKPRPRGQPRARAQSGGIELVNETSLALTTVRWDTSPSRDCLTVIARATCDLIADGAAAVRPEAVPFGGEAGAGRARALHTYPSDLAPFKARADVMLVGRAHAPRGGVMSMQVRFRFGQGARGFDRTVLVLGDRRWDKIGTLFRPSEPEPFLQMPLSNDRAFGGPGFAPNPAGVGLWDPMQRGARRMPNLEDPSARLRTPRQKAEPVGFAPLPPLSARAPRDDSASRSLPERFDWTRFQVAPPAQRTPFLLGDETFEIEGMHPKHAVFAGSLPGVAARCLAERNGASEEVPMRLDTALFDMDEQTLTLVWRGSLPVSDERAPDVGSLRLVTAPSAAASDPVFD